MTVQELKAKRDEITKSINKLIDSTEKRDQILKAESIDLFISLDGSYHIEIDNKSVCEAFKKSYLEALEKEIKELGTAFASQLSQSLYPLT